MRLSTLKNKCKRELSIAGDFGFTFALRSMFFKLNKEYAKEIESLKNVLKNENREDLIALDAEMNEWSITKNLPVNKNIFSMWWQGYDNAPELVKMCINSHKEFAKKIEANYHFISQDNINNYVSVPQEYIKLMKEGTMTVTHFSDIARMLLLEKWGGCWIDSTVYVTPECEDNIFDKEFYSFRLLNSIHTPVGVGQTITECKWASFFIVSPYTHHPLIHYIRKCLFRYWENHHSVPNYFFLNIIIRLAYDEVPSIKDLIDSIPYNNGHLYELSDVLNNKYNSDYYNYIKKDTGFFKLSWKNSLGESDGVTTFYDHLRLSN